MITALIAVLVGLVLLLWSADKFIDGAASIASHFGMPTLLIGMVILGFGTSAPEMLVSALAAMQGNPSLALGNAYGSNIANIALVLGITALISPIAVQSQILRKELPILSGITGLAILQLLDGNLSRGDALLLLGVFFVLMAWTIIQGMREKDDTLGIELDQEIPGRVLPLNKSWLWLAVGLVILLASSRLLVWGAIDLARGFGVSELIIGLTIVAVGTSLPELVSSVLAARKGEHDMALGNVIGSNLFNTLAVVGIAGSISPFAVEQDIINRDVSIMALLTVSLFVIGFSFRKGSRRINRYEGGALLACFCAYLAYLVHTYLAPSAGAIIS
ncbi:calcium/sodium antiporter [Parahaliea maris]|uniref:Calcium/sodium antiporter n=1 Tax=Parahaliea maris TaxID=2716870 RepID=A0A5C8ZMX1_9GAMM|nr:calcium/sodium antiporter [Parahaliea maris]TXS89808.1 calcium/sodium antiporter [Parahaliea maris]